MQYLMVAVGVVAVIVLVLEILAKIPAKYRDLDTPRIRSLVELLYVRGLDGGYLQFEARDFPQGFRIYKRIHAPGQVDLDVRIPAETLGSVRLDAVREGLESWGCKVERNRLDRGDSGDLVVSCGDNLAHAVGIVETLLREVLQVEPESDCTAYVKDTHPDVSAHPGFLAPPKIPE